MEGIADFLDSIIGGIDLISYSLAIGGLIWGLFILRPWENTHKQDPARDILSVRTVRLIYQGAFSLALVQLTKIFLKIWLMDSILGRWPFPEFAETTQFIGGIIRLLLALTLAGYVYYVLRQHVNSRKHWVNTACIAVLMIISGAWLVHAAGRFDDRLLLMSLTTMHQVAAAAWIGGVFQLVSIWQLTSQKQISDNYWPDSLKRFSRVGMVTVAGILMSGVPMAWGYITTWNGFIGTGYGNILLVKILLLAIALGFAWLNRSAVLQYFSSANKQNVFSRVPYYIEAETFVLITLLFTAASLASQPPAIDIPELTATWGEVLHSFAPRIPRTTSPSHAALLAGEAGRLAIIGQTPSAAATAWSDYNHNIAGIFVTVMSLFAMLSYRKSLTWTRYWPIGFIGLGVFILLRADAETWPNGTMGFWESMLKNGEIFQHRIATLLVFLLGGMELRARMTSDPDSKLPYVFPILCAFGGLMLLTHSHVGFQAKSYFLIQIGHTFMGLFALIMAIGRWLELKLDSPGKNIAGFISVFAFFQIGLILIFYQEPLY
ncbi:copper resistance protein D [Bathymodiolus japonicus methanotrophic gill symbiont]|uniref:copper resistance D family protein n=1 Tax=Bathymodiolus japonicus methanotrophic gill symbiont TaxID=113269 RepID=UPI001B7BEC82|nr:CopD family protein [Bathymodiolus japonicus methanotrophic gill symbiont]GFO73178.1 copper resistance protein D [Bathymodiolus japonicus methanotrophic gill symbiont]